MNQFQPQNQVTGHFDRAAQEYFDWYNLPTPEGHSFRIRKTRCLELLKDVPAGSTVIDIGCGPGIMVEKLLNRGFKVVGLDIAPQMIKQCRTRFGQNPNASFAVASAQQIPCPNQSADVLLAMGLMEYLNDENLVLAEFTRVLKPGGITLITYPNYWSLSRIWDRITHLLAFPYLRLRRRNQTATVGVKHREYRLNQTLEALRHAGFNVTDVVFYNFKLALRPLDKWTPKFFVKLAEKLEPLARRPVWRQIGTGFILKAERPS